MPAQTVIILHGYSDEAKSFGGLAAFLSDHGFDTKSIYLANYITLEDEITIPDLAEALELKLKALNVQSSFDLIAHSTGALVAREWLTRFYLERQKNCPVNHFLMLAPANFGSPLGSVGKTMLGRIVKGWNSDFQSGTQVLSSLEMGSRYTWSLALRDTLVDNTFYTPEICKAAVFVGSHPYQEGLRKLVDKDGGDGTVYVCTANLNTSWISLDMGLAGEKPIVLNWRSKQDIAFAVYPNRTHTTITQPDGRDDLGERILRFLTTVTPDDYAVFSKDCSALTAKTLPEAPTDPIYHTYQNVVSHAVDSLGFAIKDYFLEFYEATATSETNEIDDLMVAVHSDIIEAVHTFGDDASYRSLIFDLTDLATALETNNKLVFSLSAAPLSDLVGYCCDHRNDVGEFPITKGGRLWKPSQTLLAELIVSRRQGSDKRTAFEFLNSLLHPVGDSSSA
ncbi:MAG TPA: hypothetical protein VKC60_17685 [Opitutaceae bacterium]|nr:hypothetical protein [Opitutaceae bacterium]